MPKEVGRGVVLRQTKLKVESAENVRGSNDRRGGRRVRIRRRGSRTARKCTGGGDSGCVQGKEPRQHQKNREQGEEGKGGAHEREV